MLKSSFVFRHEKFALLFFCYKPLMKGVVKQLYCVLCMYLLREKKYLVGIQNKYSWHFLDLICTKEHNNLSYHTTKSLYRDIFEFIVSVYVWILKSKPAVYPNKKFSLNLSSVYPIFSWRYWDLKIQFLVYFDPKKSSLEPNLLF